MSENKPAPKRLLLNLLFDGAESVSNSQENAKLYLKEEGVDVERFVSEGLRRIKQIQMKAKAMSTKKDFSSLQRIREEAQAFVKNLILQPEFSFGAFVLRENISLQNRNIESFTEEDIEKSLTDYFTLKMSQDIHPDEV